MEARVYLFTNLAKNTTCLDLFRARRAQRRYNQTVACHANMTSMIDKKIYRYSNVELFDILKNGTDKTEIENAEKEFNSRNLTKEQKAVIESDYLKYKEYQNKRKDEPLTYEEWLSFFFLPFFTPRPRSREDHFSESEMERFEKYGFVKKAEEAKKVKAFGILFWFVIIISSFLIYNYLKR